MGPAKGKLSACSRPLLTPWKRPTPVCSLRKKRITLRPLSSSEPSKRKNMNHPKKNQTRNKFIHWEFGVIGERERKREATVVGCDVSTCWKLARRHLRRRVLHPCVDSCVIVAYTQACRDDGIYAGGREKFPAVEDAPHGRGQQKYSFRFSTLAAAAAAADLGMNVV